MMRRRRSRRGDRDGRDQRPEAHGETSPEDERTHRRFAGEAKAALETPPAQSGDVIDFAAMLRQKRAEADRLEQRYDRRLENPVRMTIAIDQSQAVRARLTIPFEVRVAPNDTVMDGQAQIGSGAVNAQIENVHPWIREYVRKKAEDPAFGPTNDWTRFVKRVGEQDPGIAGIHARPLIKDSSLPKDWVQKAHPWAAKGPVKKAVEQTYPKQEGNTSIASFFGSYKSQHGEDWAGWSDYLLGNFKGTIHNGEGIWRGAFHAMQEMIFDESKQQNAGQELAAAFVKRIEAGRSGGIPFEEELSRDEIVAALRAEASRVFDAEPDCIAMFAVAGRKMVSATQPGNEGRAVTFGEVFGKQKAQIQYELQKSLTSALVAAGVTNPDLMLTAELLSTQTADHFAGADEELFFIKGTDIPRYVASSAKNIVVPQDVGREKRASISSALYRSIGEQNLAANRRLHGFQIGEIERENSNGVVRKYRVVLHHGQPIYLGGGHQIEMLVPVDELSKNDLGESLHDILHRRIDEGKVDILFNGVNQEVSLSVSALDNFYQGNLSVLFGKLFTNGKIKYEERDELSLYKR